MMGKMKGQANGYNDYEPIYFPCHAELRESKNAYCYEIWYVPAYMAKKRGSTIMITSSLKSDLLKHSVSFAVPLRRSFFEAPTG